VSEIREKLTRLTCLKPCKCDAGCVYFEECQRDADAALTVFAEWLREKYKHGEKSRDLSALADELEAEVKGEKHAT
jgi:hypothetical protein